MSWWKNASLLVKIALPQILVIGVCVMIISSANNAFDKSDAAVADILDHDVKKTVAVLQSMASLNQAAVNQKNVLMATDKAFGAKQLESWGKEIDGVKKTISDLESTEDDAARLGDAHGDGVDERDVGARPQELEDLGRICGVVVGAEGVDPEAMTRALLDPHNLTPAGLAGNPAPTSAIPRSGATNENPSRAHCADPFPRP